MAIELTLEQRAAVENRGGDLLVSAAAGSGKTRVLVERLMDHISRGAKVDDFLIITFTNAAAAELRQRIAAAIHNRMALHPEDRHLRRSATLVYKAEICTIDAFCLDFLRQWGHMVDLDPDFRLCDEAEGDELRAKAMEAVLERRYASIDGDPGFAALADMLAGERNDYTLEDVIYDMHRRVQAQPDPEQWLMERRGDFLLPEGTMPEDTVWGKLLLGDALEEVECWLERLDDLCKEIQGDELIDRNYGPSLEVSLAGLEKLAQGLRQGWDQGAACFPVEFPRPGAKRGECDPVLRERVKDLRGQCSDSMKTLAERFAVSGKDAMEDVAAIAPAMAALLEVTAEFDREFIARKRARRLIDFADGEHLTARLLADCSGAPTQLAVEWGQRYREIMVDEYQDTNAVQNTIFKALSNGKNLFMVGDVKQSIYRFRLADPTIFLEKAHRFRKAEEAAEGEGRIIRLSQNFRSRPEVLEGTNFVFRNIMTPMAGEIDYSGEALVPGRTDFPEDPLYRVELNCVDLAELGESDEGKTEKDLIEARAVASRIHTLLREGYQVDGRPLRAEDMVILLRSPGPVLRHYGTALDEVGIPWTSDGGREFFGTTEIAVATALLQVVDNPRQDVPLLAALRSPVFGFSADRLAMLRSNAGGSVYDILRAGAARGEKDCVRFLELLDVLRDLACEEGSHRLLSYIYEHTDMTAVFAAMADGHRRRANLMALYDEACRFESGGHRGLMAFLEHLTRMAENDVPVPVAGEEGGGVRILSIHRSKGLEFPVVFLCGLERQFNEGDMRETILFHPELGLGPKRTDRSRMLRHTTLPREAVALRLKRQLRAEEMRLLYVAMTRAEQKLILFTAVNGRNNSMKSLARNAQCPPHPRQVAAARSMAEWVLWPALCRADSTPLWSGMAEERPVPGIFDDRGWDMRLVDGSGFEGPQGIAAAPEEEQAAPVPEGLAERLLWRYPHMAAANIPSKLTATQLKGRDKDREAAEEGQAMAPVRGKSKLRKPCFEKERPLSPTERGTALHLVMQHLDFNCTADEEEIREEIWRLAAEGYVTAQQAEAADAGAILRFFRSHLGEELRKSVELRREFKFSMLVPAHEYYGELSPDSGEEVLLQGVVDCWFRDGDGRVTVLDFKTDRVTEETLAQRAEEYRRQLDIYSRAMAEILGFDRVRRVLWFFALGRGVEL